MYCWLSIYKTHEHYSLLIKTWNYLQKIIKGPASLSVAHDRMFVQSAWLIYEVVN